MRTQITDLNAEGAFGFAGTRMIQLDDDALGFGWHVGSGSVPEGTVDLGTVMRHELGHILGYGDLDPATAGDSIMSGSILPGERREVTDGINHANSPNNTPVAGPGSMRRQALLSSPAGHAAAAPDSTAITRVAPSGVRGHAVSPNKSGIAVAIQISRKNGRSSEFGFGSLIPEANAAGDHQTLDELFSSPLESF